MRPRRRATPSGERPYTSTRLHVERITASASPASSRRRASASGEPILLKRERLAHRDGRRLVVQPHDDDHRTAPATAGTSVAQANVKTITAKPAIASHAARRPPHPHASARRGSRRRSPTRRGTPTPSGPPSSSARTGCGSRASRCNGQRQEAEAADDARASRSCRSARGSESSSRTARRAREQLAFLEQVQHAHRERGEERTVAEDGQEYMHREIRALEQWVGALQRPASGSQ